MLNPIISAFNACFSLSHHTKLVGGAAEPLYRPNVPGEHLMHVVYFREDFISSALHEVAHWCLAGSVRRKLEDYGYWYQASRNEVAQQTFEKVEVYPQAIEWMLSVAAGVRFRVSIDNLEIKNYDSLSFRRKVYSQVHLMLQNGLPHRARILADELAGSKIDYACPEHYRHLPD